MVVVALSRGAARTVRHRRWLWALAACGGAAGLIVAEEQLEEQARERGQTTVEFAQERAIDAATNLRHATAVAGALLRTAASSVMDAAQQRRFDPGQLQSALAATLADLAADPPARHQLLAWGGGALMDWVLQAAYPDPHPHPHPHLEHLGPGPEQLGARPELGPGPGLWQEIGGGGAGVRSGGAGPAGQAQGAGLLARNGGNCNGHSWELEPVGPVLEGPAGTGLRDVEAEAAAAARLGVEIDEWAAGGGGGSREAERALEIFLADDAASQLLLSRPGAVPRLLRAVAAGRASRGVAAGLGARAGQARAAAEEAMTADLGDTVELLRSSSSPALQRLAAGLLTAWAAGCAANRDKLTGLGLQGAVAELMTAVSGRGERSAEGLQWELLRLARVMAEHSSSSDSHHLASCVLPLLYTAADAAAAADAVMASYAVDTLAAAVRHGGAPVAAHVRNSTMPHLLWQLADGMASYKKPVAPSAPSAAAPGTSGDGGSGAAGTAAPAKAPAATAPAASTTGSFWSRWRFGGSKSVAPPAAASVTSSSSAAPAAAPEGAKAAISAGAGPGGNGTTAGGGGAAATPTSARRGAASVWIIRDPTLAAAVASAVCELARSALLPEAQVARWRDWLLDVMCGQGFESCSLQAAVADVMGATSTEAVPEAEAVRPARSPPSGDRLRGQGRGQDRTAGGGADANLPAWLALPTLCGGEGGSGGRRKQRREEKADFGALQGSIVTALEALSHMPGNHGLQAAHYWLSRLLSELAARTLPYTSLVYGMEGPLLRDPQDLVHVVPVGPAYVRSVADALERAADAVAEDAPPLPLHLEFELAGSGLVGRTPHALEADRAAAAAYRRAAHVVDVVLAERKAADALEALCAIVAPDPVKQRWLLQRGVLPLLHRLTRTADDPRVTLPEAGQPGAEPVEVQQAAVSLRTQHPAHHSPNTLQHEPKGTKASPGTTSSVTATAAAGAAVSSATSPRPPADQLLSDQAGGPSLCLQRQVARMLALLALLPGAQSSLGAVPGPSGDPRVTAGTNGAVGAIIGGNGRGNWMAWLRHAATSSDCRLSSNATRALLHAAAVTGNAATAAEVAAVMAPADAAVAAAAVAAAAPPPPPVFHDGIHLLDPGARHHWALAQHTAAAVAQAVTAAATAVVDASAAAEATEAAEAEAMSDKRLSAGKGMPPPVAMAVSHFADQGTAALQAAAAGSPSEGLTGLGVLSYALTRPLSLLWNAAVLTGAGFVALGGGDAAASPTGGGGPASRTTSSWATAASAPPAAEPPVGDAGVTSDGAGTGPNALTPGSAGGDGCDSGGGSKNSETEAPQTKPSSTKDQAPSSTVTVVVQAPPLVPSAAAAAGQSGSALPPPPQAPAAGAPPPLPPLPPYPAPYPEDPLPSDDTAAAATADAAAASSADSPPQVDVVFIHGIRGGPFITWRKAGVMTRGSAASHMERTACWPSTWLAEDFPGARLLSVEYLAPVSAWEGESLPLEANVSRVMEQLAAAGVGTGQRPVVFVAHSMGGLLVKEMLARSVEQADRGGPHASLAPSTRGVVFFGTPHFGNAMAAMGWKLRHVPGAHPAPSLARLTPGPHLLSLNDRLRELHDSQPGDLRVVSMLEGQPTQLAGGVIPRILVVAPDSAYPGFGAAMVLPNNDHIDVCKPDGKTAPAYKVVRDVVTHAMAGATAAAEAVAPGGG